MAVFDSIKVYALLNNAWTDLTSDVLSRGSSARWGMFGYSHTNIIADVGEFRFTLKNIDDKYNPDGSSPLSGWGAGIKVKIIFTYDGFSYNRFLGYIPKDGLRFSVGKTANESTAEVTVLDWMKYATDTPIISPAIEEDKTADEAIALILDRVPFPVSTDLETGDYTFPTIFDGTSQKTTAYSEFSRVAYSESPGYIYLIKQRDSGQLLRFENSTYRDAPTQKNTYSLAMNYWKNHDGGNWINHADDKFKNHTPTESDETAVTLDSDIDAIEPYYGTNIVNYATATAYPKRIDDSLQVLYRLPHSTPISDGETVNITGRYVDPFGGSNINAIVSSMQTPAAPGGADPTLVCLINFTDASYTEDTGRHVITLNDCYAQNGEYNNGYDTILNAGVFGRYGLWGGYSNFKMTMPASNDFDLFNGTPCSIGFFAAIFNTNSGQALLTRDNTTSYPPYLLGYASGAGSDIKIYMSSNGSSWDVANGKSWGVEARNRWVYYELNYENGFFYAFSNGVLTDKWYSATALPASSNPITFGQTQTSVWQWFAMDMFFIRKGICLHKTDFDPPTRSMSATLDGDYLLNSAEDGSGTDLSSSLAIVARYGPDKVDYTLTNNSGSDGYLIHLQARGRGLYNYDRITATEEDAASITANGYQTLSINQYYQQDLTAGAAWISDIVTAEKDSRTVLRSISFYANRSANNMLRFLQCDVGDLIRVTIATQNIDGYYHIQNVGWQVQPGNIVYVTWGLVEGETPA